MMVIPRPIRDILSGISEIAALKAFFNTAEAGSAEAGSVEAALFRSFGGGSLAAPSAKKITKAVCRIATATAGFFAALALQKSVLVAAPLGCALSLPAVSIVGAAWLCKFGATAILASLSTGSFTTLGTGLSACAGGWLALEHHDIFPFGTLELSFISLAEASVKPILSALQNY